MRTDHNSQPMKDLAQMTGLHQTEIEVRIERAIAIIDDIDTSITSINDYHGDELCGILVCDYLTELPQLTIMANEICEGLTREPMDIVRPLLDVVLIGDGDCPDCGSHRADIHEKKGYYTQAGSHRSRSPLRVVGAVTVKCLNCGTKYDIK